MAANLIVSHLLAPVGYTPDFVVVSKKGRTECNFIARRTTSPPINDKTVNISFTLIDTETVRRNFGDRIASNYHVATIEVHNPTAKKLQLTKSSIWFNVDYVEAVNSKPAKKAWEILGFTSELNSNEIFIPQDGRVFRYGIDHTQKQFPHTFTQILAAFDATNSAKNAKTARAELLGSFLSSVAISVNDTNYGIATHLIAGLIIPGIKAIALNPEEENRKRSNLVNQALQNNLQISPSGTASTIVFLPRKGILAFVDRGEVSSSKDTTLAENKPKSQLKHSVNILPKMQRPNLGGTKNTWKKETFLADESVSRRLVPVVIKKVLEVKWDPEVISELNSEPVTKNFAKAGMTKDQVRSALGEPDTVATGEDAAFHILLHSRALQQNLFRCIRACNYIRGSADRRSGHCR